MEFDRDGWLQDVPRCESPNQDERPPGTLPTLVVIHAISLPPDDFGGPWIFDLFANRLDPQAHPYFAGIHQLRVSAHFLVRRDGEVIQFVSCDQRAWHAGVSQWQGRERCNDFSIGIELEGCDAKPFDAAQYDALKPLLQAILREYPITAVVGHCHVAPERKTDPGPYFDWQQLRCEFATVAIPDMQKS